MKILLFFLAFWFIGLCIFIHGLCTAVEMPEDWDDGWGN